jgi:predicted RNA-binding protein with PUA-like domain
LAARRRLAHYSFFGHARRSFLENEARPARQSTILITRMNYWLIKQEPETYSWADLVKEKNTAWTGVRNFQARNNLKAMKKGDLVCFYHSGKEKRIMGLASVAREAYADPTADAGNWVGVDVAPFQPFQKPVPLELIKRNKSLKDIALIRNSRLSVMPLTHTEFQHLLWLGGTKI